LEQGSVRLGSLRSARYPSTDKYYDADTDLTDLAILLSAYGTPCP